MSHIGVKGAAFLIAGSLLASGCDKTRNVIGLDKQAPDEFAGEHYDLIKAIEDRDEDRADQLAHCHTVQVSDRFLSSLGVRHTSEMATTVDEPVQAPSP